MKIKVEGRGPVAKIVEATEEEKVCWNHCRTQGGWCYEFELAAVIPLMKIHGYSVEVVEDEKAITENTE